MRVQAERQARVRYGKIAWLRADAGLCDARQGGLYRASAGNASARWMGGEIYTAAERALQAASQRETADFVAHGMGLVSNEAPRLTTRGPVRYDAADATRPLQVGMVISVETTMKHPRRGFIKLEDTAAVTPTGHVGINLKGK